MKIETLERKIELVGWGNRPPLPTIFSKRVRFIDGRNDFRLSIPRGHFVCVLDLFYAVYLFYTCFGPVSPVSDHLMGLFWWLVDQFRSFRCRFDLFFAVLVFFFSRFSSVLDLFYRFYLFFLPASDLFTCFLPVSDLFYLFLFPWFYNASPILSKNIVFPGTN